MTRQANTSRVKFEHAPPVDTRRLPLRASTSVSVLVKETLARDDGQARGLRLLLLGKGAVFAHRFERSLLLRWTTRSRRRAVPPRDPL